MPYNVENEKDEDTKFMESCVKKVMKTGKDKSSSIAICKTTLQKKKDSNQEDTLIANEIKEFDIYKNQFIRKTMSMLGISFNVANALFELDLIKKGYEYTGKK
jgi:hypothetical protein